MNDFNKLFAILMLLFTVSATATANADVEQETNPELYDTSCIFARYDTTTLAMNIFMPRDNEAKHRCIVFIYGGGFKDHNLYKAHNQEFCRKLADEGHFTVAAIDYRLGLKDAKYKGALGMIKPLDNAVHWAAEDCFKAVKYLIDHAVELRLDPDCIILCGGSAGAITALQSDYELCNRTEISSILPDDFHFAGIVAFSGAIFSHEGRVKYKSHAPAPTMMLHGMNDKLVTYDKISFFKTRFSGSNDLVKQFKKNHYPHLIIRFEEEGHGVASRYMECYDQLIWFIDKMVIDKQYHEIDTKWFDHGHERTQWDTSDPGDLY